MANDLNQCQFIGRLGKDPEVRYTPGGKAVASFSIAVGSSWKDASGEKQEATEWVNVTAFDKLGEICGEYLKKGSQAFISGRMRTEKYDDKEGVTRYSTKIIADRMQMLGGKAEGGERAPAPAPRRSNAPGSASEYGSAGSESKTGFDDMDDDIPF